MATTIRPIQVLTSESVSAHATQDFNVRHCIQIILQKKNLLIVQSIKKFEFNLLDKCLNRPIIRLRINIYIVILRT